MFRFRLWLKIRFNSISMVSWSGILIKRLVTSQETRNLPERFAFLIEKQEKKYVCKCNSQVLSMKADQKVNGQDCN